MCGFPPASSFPFLRGCVAGWLGQETQRVRACRPGGVLGIPCSMQSGGSARAPPSALQPRRRHLPGLAGWFPPAHTQPVTHSETSAFRGRALAVDFTLVSHLQSTFHLESGAGCCGSELFLNDQTPLASHPPSLQATSSSRCGRHCASLPGSCWDPSVGLRFSVAATVALQGFPHLPLTLAVFACR